MTESLDHLVVVAGSLVFAETDQSSFAYLIKRGRIEIFVTRYGREVSLVTRGPGEIVGEIAILDRGPRSTSARAVEDCELALITPDHLDNRLRNADPVLRMLLDVVIGRYRETIALLDHSSIRRSGPFESSRAMADFHTALSMLLLENELKRAIDRGELELAFQPIIRFPNRRLVGFEALVRWNHPQRGPLLPDVFIPVAEASGLITEITFWCLVEIGRVFPRIMAAALQNVEAVAPLFISVNISGQDLENPSFVASLAGVLKASGVDPRHIRLEISESNLMKKPVAASKVLEACRRLGTKVAIDDFGTGYSSLSHLSTMPITAIQIDQSFVHSMIADPVSRRIIHMILRLAEELNIPVVAEGIETEQEARDLQVMGCALGQGYLFGRPLPAAETVILTRGWTTTMPAAVRIPPRRVAAKT